MLFLIRFIWRNHHKLLNHLNDGCHDLTLFYRPLITNKSSDSSVVLRYVANFVYLFNHYPKEVRQPVYVVKAFS